MTQSSEPGTQPDPEVDQAAVQPPAPGTAPDAPGEASAPEIDASVADPSLAALVTEEPPMVEDVPVPPPAAALPAAALPVVALPPLAPPPAAPPLVATAAPAAPVVIQQVAPARPRRSALSVIRRVLAFLFGVLQALLIVRILLLLLNANPDDSIVNAVMTITQPFVDPFLGMFNLDSIEGANGSVVDVAAIVALVAWTLIETLLLSLLRLFDRRAR